MTWVTSLIRWFESNKRAMPWRERDDVYAIWISESMLQQTQVVTVIPYYIRFMKRFPSVKALAKAPLDDVLKHWEGLGYYSRARNLHKAANEVVDAGGFPPSYETLQTLPGVGPYIAAAIASIALGEKVPVVDGNVIRVFARFWMIASDGRSTGIRKELFQRLQECMPARSTRAFSEAMMELGALICTPKNPDCATCPLQRHCEAFRHKRVADYPVMTKRKKVPHVEIAVGIIEKNGRVLIGQRPTDKMLGGLWEFPGGKIEKGETKEEALHRELREELGVDVEVSEKITTVKHAYSHFTIAIHAFRCRIVRGRIRKTDHDVLKWVHQSEFSDYAFPSANQKIISALRR